MICFLACQFSVHLPHDPGAPIKVVLGQQLLKEQVSEDIELTGLETRTPALTVWAAEKDP